MDSERWLPVEGYVGLYAISDHGRVMSMDYARTGLPGILAPRKANGYLSVQLSNAKGPRPFTIQYLVARAFIGQRPLGKQINHKDGDKHNNHVSNLEYVTASENRKHAFRIGLQSMKGEHHSRARLNDEKVRLARRLLSQGWKHKDIASEIGTSRSNVSLIASCRAWTHVQEILQ